jgi:hypothetical protein
MLKPPKEDSGVPVSPIVTMTAASSREEPLTRTAQERANNPKAFFALAKTFIIRLQIHFRAR